VFLAFPITRQDLTFQHSDGIVVGAVIIYIEERQMTEFAREAYSQNVVGRDL